jgi:8-amino-7-oxononanoate synthase
LAGFQAELEERLRQAAAAGLRRELAEPAGLDFASNDYLGFAVDPRLRSALLRRLQEQPSETALAAPASRLLRGTTREHLALERRLAAFKGTEAALLFPSGFQANLAVLTTCLKPEDRVLSDAQNHASLIDGLRLARCRKVVFPHLDEAAIEAALALPHPSGRTFLVTESLFSMDGDIAPLDRYAKLAARYGAELIVDDAHAVGLFGERSSGLTESFGVERQALAITSTLGKALGAAGAFVAGSRILIDALVHFARPFLFTTALSPLAVAATEVSLDALAAEPGRPARALALADALRTLLGRGGIDCLDSRGPIVPVILGDNRRALAVAERVRQQGFDVRAVRPPTVAPGTARLRVSVHADHSAEQIEALAAAILAAVEEVG